MKQTMLVRCEKNRLLFKLRPEGLKNDSTSTLLALTQRAHFQHCCLNLDHRAMSYVIKCIKYIAYNRGRRTANLNPAAAYTVTSWRQLTTVSTAAGGL